MSVAIRVSLVLLLVAAVLGLMVPQEAEGVKHVVGDDIGWTVPPDLNYYSSWASNRTFSVSDILAFGYAFGQHDFAEVTKDSNGVCNATEPIRLGTIGWINYSLDNPGDYYFICTFLYQCVRGQKLAVHVPPPPGSQSPLIATALPPVLNVVIAASTPSPPPLPGTQAAPIERCFLLY